MSNINIKKLEADLWEAADELRANSKLTSNQYCMPTLALLFLRYAYGRFKVVKAEIEASRPSRGGRVMPVEERDFRAKSALFLPEEARFDYLVNLPDGIASLGLKDKEGNQLNSLGEVINNAMKLVEAQSEQLKGILPKNYTDLPDDLLAKLLRIFNNQNLDDVGGDVMGRIYEYFLSKFAKAVASDDGVFFTPKSLVKMLVNVLEPERGVMLDPACGSGGMFIQSGDFINNEGNNANTQMTFYGQEKVEYNAQLCLMNLAVHGLNGKVVSGDDANSFYHDFWNLEGKCDYVMANPPFNVNKVNSEAAYSAGRLPFGLPGFNDKTKEIGNANYLWISYFYSYLNARGRAGFVMASSATDSANKDKLIREQLVKTGHVDVMISVGNNFFYTLSLPCSLWFFDKGKKEELRDKVLFIDARNYYTVVDRTLNEWTEWQLKNLQAIVHLYRGETDKFKALLVDYRRAIKNMVDSLNVTGQDFSELIDEGTRGHFWGMMPSYYKDDIDLSELKKHLDAQVDQTKKCVSCAEQQIPKRQVKSMRQAGEAFCGVLTDIMTVIGEYEWLTEKFGEGNYQDVLGLCKIATLSEIEEKNYSLTPGAYVGVAEVEDDGVDFAVRMKQIDEELVALSHEATELFSKIHQSISNIL